MAENNLHRCPFMYRCAVADETCSEEKSRNCDVMYNTMPTAPPKWNPDELVAVTMTRKQWREIENWIQYGIDWHKCRVVWWRDFCDDKRMGAEIAAKHAEAVKSGESMLQIIEEATHEENKTQ